MPHYVLGIFNEGATVNHSELPGFAYIASDEVKDRQPDFDKLAERYGAGKLGKIKNGFNDDGSKSPDFEPWQEINFGSMNPHLNLSDDPVSVAIVSQRLDSYTIQAIRSGNFLNASQLEYLTSTGSGQPAIIENAIQGFLVKEGKFLLGMRYGGGADLSPGLLQTVPGGSVQWKETYVHNPLRDAFDAESMEEAGARIVNAKLYGIYNLVPADPGKPGPTQRQWMHIGEPQQSIDELIGLIQAGLEFFSRQLSGGKTGIEAKQALRNSPFPDDVWENKEVWPFSYDGDTLLKLLADGQWINPNGKMMKFIGSLPAVLYIAGVVDFGDEFKKEAEKLELVKKEVIML